jgi:hypothetical protein
MADFVYKGTSALPGPLCHDFLAKDGTLYLVGNGRTNHAGSVTPAVKAAIIAEDKPASQRSQGAETVDGNDFLYGIEIENRGNGTDPYPPAQYDVAVRWAAARARYHGWSANSVWGHKEITMRKIDPSFDMIKFRKDVAARLSKPATAPTVPVAVPVVTAPATSTQSLTAGSMLYTDLNKTTAKTIAAGEEYIVYFDSETADEPSDHGAGGKTFLSGSEYTGTVAVWLDAGAGAASVNVMMRHELTDGSTSTSSSAYIDGAAVDVVRAVSVTGSIPADRKMTVVLKNLTAASVTISRVQLRLLSQAL